MKTKIILTIKKKPMQWLLPSNFDAVIDDQTEIEVPKNENAHADIEPGNHTIRVSFRYLGMDCGKTQTSFTIKEGETLLITYKVPQVVFSEGEITIER